MTTRKSPVLVKYSCLKGPKTLWWLWIAICTSGAILYAIAIKSIIHLKGVHCGQLHSTWAEMPKEPNLLLVDSGGCRIPALDPWDPKVRKFVFQPAPINCSANRGPPLVASNLTSLFIVQEAVPFYAENSSQIKCCYQPLKRSRKKEHVILLQKKCTIFETDTRVQDEFVRVQCSDDNKLLYQDYHAFVPRKPDVEKRCRNASIRSASFEVSAHSVLLLGIDAVSRLNLHRQMPLTVDLLKQMGAVEMLGLHKVADNTFPNMIPIFTGLNVEELKNNCWPTDGSYFDKCPFVWNDFRGAGFRTAYGEDATTIGTFNYYKKGFINPPTDYYLRPFMTLMEEKKEQNHTGNSHLCVDPRMSMQVLLQYVLNFARAFKKDPYFALFWAGSLSHNDVNLVGLADDMYVKFLSELRDSGALERTVLLLMSDHGTRLGPFRETYQGSMEDRLPFLFMLFPGWFREQFPTAVANVERNAHRLISHFDTFETLQDLIRPAVRLSQEAVRGRTRALAKATASPEGPPRGVSLFLPVPPDRTCDQAGIEPHWCTCRQKVPVVSSNEMVKRSAIFLVKHINQIVRSYRQCARLILVEIKNALLEISKKNRLPNIVDFRSQYYVIVVRTHPGGAIFEGTIQHILRSDELIMAGFVSRLNLYGLQSACVSNYHVKLYCYCKK